MQRYNLWLGRHYRAVVIGAVILVVAFALGLPGLSVTNDMRAYFSPDNPQLAQFEALEDTFVKQDTLYLIVRPHSGDVFTSRGLRLVAELTALGWQAPFSRRAESL
ncbi:MAG: putative RND superfamily exporter protein, partial [Gammaproteobacteria bacterium]